MHLRGAGLIERVGRGEVRILDRGRQLLLGNPKRLTIRDLSQFAEYRAFRHAESGEKNGPNGEAGQEPPPKTPEERLAEIYASLRTTLAAELLDTVMKASPAFFEKLVVDLLVRMGYGGSLEDAGQAVGRSGDDGIDGIIKEDKLGLDVVYIQAKRWTSNVGRPVVQSFVGSLEGNRARKGVLITTSDFSRDSREYVRRIDKKVVLILWSSIGGADDQPRPRRDASAHVHHQPHRQRLLRRRIRSGEHGRRRRASGRQEDRGSAARIILSGIRYSSSSSRLESIAAWQR